MRLLVRIGACVAEKRKKVTESDWFEICRFVGGAHCRPTPHYSASLGLSRLIGASASTKTHHKNKRSGVPGPRLVGSGANHFVSTGLRPISRQGSTANSAQIPACAEMTLGAVGGSRLLPFPLPHAFRFSRPFWPTLHRPSKPPSARSSTSSKSKQPFQPHS